MNKKAIWSIIGLMGLALIGSVLLQMYWINWSIKLNEDQFEKNIYAALNRVSEKLQKMEEVKERLEVYNHVNAYPLIPKYNMESTQRIQVNGSNFSLDFSATSSQFHIDSLTSIHLLDHMDGEECDCPNCQKERKERYQRQAAYQQKLSLKKLFDPPVLTQRVDLRDLDAMLRQELANRGINITYNYGVYDRKSDSFVITNGHYIVSDKEAQSTTVSWSNLYNSEYQVDLFPSDWKSPGLLMIHFPAKASLVWGSVWKTLLASILFTTIILFCFAYTIQVIFQQKKLSAMKTDFINNMTHEFKTPIATISLAADSITSPIIAGNADKVGRFANIIKQENKRMNSQVEKVLQMAVIDKREFNLKLTEIDLHEVIRQAVAHTNLQVEKRGGLVTADLQADRYQIEGDLTHVSNMIHNLLDNANKYSPDKPEISVHTRNVPNGVEVIVKDKGMGISKEARKHIFDKFYRVHTGNLHDVKGFGLGLSYVKAMMTAHKGQIDVRSEPGKGSSFILIFPFKVNANQNH